MTSFLTNRNYSAVVREVKPTPIQAPSNETQETQRNTNEQWILYDFTHIRIYPTAFCPISHASECSTEILETAEG